MKLISKILLTSALAFSTSVLADEFAELERAAAAQAELDMETGGCASTLKLQRETMTKMKAVMDSRKSRIAELEGSMAPLSSELELCKDKLAATAADRQDASQTNALQQEVQKYQQLSEERGRRIAELEEGLQGAAKENIGLNSQINALQAQLASAKAIPVKQPPNSTSITKAPQQPVLQTGGKIVGKLLSLRRTTKNNNDQLVIGVSLTNTTSETINGVLAGPEITAIDKASNMFSTKDYRNIQGITICQYKKKLYNQMSWCEEQIRKNALSTTSFRPGVSVNVLVTIPALNSDPNRESTKINANLFLLLETNDGFEKYPVDILDAAPESVAMERIIDNSNDKLVGQLLSLRRETNKKKDELVLGVSLTNNTNKTIHGVLVGPEITAIDNSNNMFSNDDQRNLKGITICQYGNKLYNQMSWCEGQIKSNALSTTSFRSGVPVNVLVTIPAINADPDSTTTKVNTTLFLLLEDKENGEYEKFPVDILGAKPSA